ncbi:hypothetical protein BGZ94_006948 [Podila epigama]|nr:hypothetical protein BGZ94_006948 [Podila epigama]
MYEAHCANGEQHFDAIDASQLIFTSVNQATASTANKRAMYSAFFDMDDVKSICKSHRLELLRSSRTPSNNI